MLRRAQENDISAIAKIDRLSFSGNQADGAAERWYKALLCRGDQYQILVWEENGKIVSFIGWELLGGFSRGIPVLELQKLATLPESRGKGIATKLVTQSFELMRQWIARSYPKAKSMRVAVWVAKHNGQAKKVYTRICNEGVKGERDMYGQGKEEVLLRGEYELW